MNYKILYLLGIVFFLGCAKEQIDTTTDNNTNNQEQSQLLSTSEIDEIVWKSLKETNRFYWKNVDDNVVMSALSHSDSLLSIGYSPDGIEDFEMAEIDINDNAWKKAREKLIETIAKAQGIPTSELSFYQGETLPYIQIRTANLAVISAIRNLKEVRYADPMGYGATTVGAMQRSGSGCGDPDPLSALPAGDYANYGYNAFVPWNHLNMGITAAHSQSNKGAGITVGLIDTGIGEDQDNLGNKFATGSSYGRWIDKNSTYLTCSGWWWWYSCDNEGPNDQCNHGTQMAGIIAAPKGTNTKAVVGVAYRSNLIAYRATSDVIINASEEKQGVSDALVDLGYSNAKIISMSIGDVFHSGQVEDAVEFAYGKGKLIFAAAGTSLTWTNWYGVIFPAYLSETVAVTGITDRPNTYEECSTCHYGSEVDFAVIMQRWYNNDRTSLTLSIAYNSPTNLPEYVGGSSCATATMAGTAALVWSDHQNWSRSQILLKLKQSSDYYPSRHSNFGYGTVSAVAAVN